VDSATKIAGGAERIIGGTIDTAANLVGGTIGTAADLAQGVGSGFMQLVNNNTNSVNGAATGSVVSGGASTGSAGGYLPSTSDKTFGNIPGKTSIDNYSYYGALQSKGSNYMPVTADFSSFRK
jgi:phage-related protein